MKSCLLCGVGGQGTVLASRIIAAAAMEKDWSARTAETIGMAQRGGCVVSHVRIGEKVLSPVIPFGTADVVVGFEPGEVVRNLEYLKPGGLVIICDRAVQPVTALIGGSKYSAQEMIDFIKVQGCKCIVVNVDRIEEKFSTLKVLNVVLLGALAESKIMGISMEDMEKAVRSKVKAKLVDMNIKALALGAEFVK